MSLFKNKIKMDKNQKFEYLQNVEGYLEEKHVFDLLQELMRQLMVHRPENPYDFMIKKL